MPQFSETQKKEIVNQYKDGERIKNICKEYEVSKSTLYNWINQYSEIKTANGKITNIRRIYLLEKQVERLTKELQILKKSKRTLDSPLSDKLNAIESLYKEYGIHACCRVLEVLRSTFYHHLFRSPKQTFIQKDDEIFKPIINKIFEKTKGRIGAKKIRAIMVQQGHTITPERIRRLISEMGLVCVTQRKHIKYNFSGKGKYKSDKLKRNFNQTKPNTVWVSDITRLYVNYKPYYLCVIIDLFSRKVIAHCIADNQETPLILKVFKKAYEVRNCPTDLMFHSDQGGQYTSYAFRQYLNKRRIKLSYSNPGIPYDNAVAESFFRTLKAEETSCKFYHTLDELITSVDEYISFFNETRPHQSFKYLTPNEVENNYYKVKK